MPQRITPVSIIVIVCISAIIGTSLPIEIKLPPRQINVEINENNQILSPTLANPAISQAGDNVRVIYKTNISDDPNEIFLNNEFANYLVEVIQITGIDINGERSMIISTNLDILPLIYSLIVTFPNSLKIFSYNSIKITDEDLYLLDNYSFVHFTDTHISGLQNRYEQVSRLISEINLLNPDFCLLTGDIVEGLTTDNQGNMITAEIQYPQALALLKELNIPVFIISGNHDFQINDKQNGNELWSKYFGKVGNVINFTYSQDQFVGVSLFDENGLTYDQLQKIETIYTSSSSSSFLNVFFAHHDYKNQFPLIYQNYGINLSLLGHEHITIERNVSGTVENALDNSITFTEAETGHYRLYTINSEKEIAYEELEVEQLRASISTESNNESSIMIHINIQNFHPISFSNLKKEIILLGNWRSNQIIESSNIDMHFNGSHTLIYLFMDIEAKTEYNSEIILSSSSGSYSWIINSSIIEITFPFSDSSSQSSEQDNGVNFITLKLFVFSLLVSTIILRNNKRKKKQ
ncbi:MAG: metallophosphoesterase [Candidatus Heimdallarchaeota archaeon]|nr:metallophosphoesterase [Candidatus Heimdallarchaeota archaeon]